MRERYEAELHPQAEDTVRVRDLDSDLRGFGLQPSSAAIPANSKYLDKFGMRSKEKSKNDPKFGGPEKKASPKSRIKLTNK
jgi:hypothetical protein